MQRAIDRAMSILQLLLGLSLIVAVLLNFANVIGRYVFGTSILWADEIEMVILVTVTFLGAAIVAWRRQHLVMDMLVQRMPVAMQLGLRVIETLVLILIAALVGQQSYVYANQMFKLGRLSDNAGIPMWLPHSTVAVGFALMSLIAIWHAAADIRRRSSDRPAAPHATDDAKGPTA